MHAQGGQIALVIAHYPIKRLRFSPPATTPPPHEYVDGHQVVVDGGDLGGVAAWWQLRPPSTPLPCRCPPSHHYVDGHQVVVDGGDLGCVTAPDDPGGRDGCIAWRRGEHA